MYATFTEFLHLLVTLPLWVVLACAAGAVMAFRSAPGRPLRRWRWVWVAAAVGVYGAATQAVSNRLLAGLEARYPLPQAQLQQLQQSGQNVRIVVLSAGWFRSVPGGMTVEMGGASWERTWAGVMLWRKLGGRLILSGAPLADHSDSVARHMADAAQALGVPAAQIDVETESRNTYENLVFTQRRFLQGNAPVVLVTSAMHLPRAVAIAQHLGLHVVPVPCDWRAETGRLHWRLWLPSNDGTAQLEEVLHEVVGLWIYRLRGWA